MYKAAILQGMEEHYDTYSCFGTAVIELKGSEHSLTTANAPTFEAIGPTGITFLDPNQLHSVPLAIRSHNRIAITITI